MPLLSTFLWLPIAGAILLAFFPRAATGAIKTFGLAVSLITFVISLGVLRTWDDAKAGFQFVESMDWIPQWGIRYALGIDGITLWLVLLTTFLTPIILLSAWKAIHKHPKEYVISFLVMETAMIGAFLATDLLLFYIFFELMLLPMYLVIGVWGGANRIYAAIKFFLFTVAGSLLMLLAIIYLAFQNYHQNNLTPTFSIADLYGTPLTPTAQLLLFLAFSLAFAIKVPLFPLHTWLPDAHVEAPTGGSIILAGVMLKMGTYGFLRFVLPFFPEMSMKWANVLIALSLIGIIYGALVAWVQPDMKKLVAYSSVSHLGFCVLGIFAFQQTAIEGSILQMVNHGLSTGALFLLVGVIYERRHTRLLADYGGIGRTMPVFTTFFVIAVLSSVGLPGLNGFVGEFMILAGTFKTHPIAATIASSGVILAAIYLLWLVQKVFFGPITNEENKNIPDMAWHEVAAMVPLVIFMVWIGVHPNTFLKKMEPSVAHLLRTVNGERANEPMLAGVASDQLPVARKASPGPNSAGNWQRATGNPKVASNQLTVTSKASPRPNSAGNAQLATGNPKVASNQLTVTSKASPGPNSAGNRQLATGNPKVASNQLTVTSKASPGPNSPGNWQLATGNPKVASNQLTVTSKASPGPNSPGNRQLATNNPSPANGQLATGNEVRR